MRQAGRTRHVYSTPQKAVACLYNAKCTSRKFDPNIPSAVSPVVGKAAELLGPTGWFLRSPSVVGGASCRMVGFGSRKHAVVHVAWSAEWWCGPRGRCVEAVLPRLCKRWAASASRISCVLCLMSPPYLLHLDSHHLVTICLTFMCLRLPSHCLNVWRPRSCLPFGASTSRQACHGRMVSRRRQRTGTGAPPCLGSPESCSWS